MRKSADDAYRIRVPNPDMTELWALQADSDQIQKVALYERSAYVYLHSKPFAILYADQAGKCVYCRKTVSILEKKCSPERMFIRKIR